MSGNLKDFLCLLIVILIIGGIIGGIGYIIMNPKPYSDQPSTTFDNAIMSFNHKKSMEVTSLNDPVISVVSISNNSEVLCAFYKKTSFSKGNGYYVDPIMVISKLHESGNPKEISEKYKAQFEEEDFLILSEKNRTIDGSTAYQVNYRGFYPGSYENYYIDTKFMTIIIFENKGNLYQIVYWSSYSPESNYFSNKDFNYILDTLKIK